MFALVFIQDNSGKDRSKAACAAMDITTVRVFSFFPYVQMAGSVLYLET